MYVLFCSWNTIFKRKAYSETLLGPSETFKMESYIKSISLSKMGMFNCCVKHRLKIFIVSWRHSSYFGDKNAYTLILVFIVGFILTVFEWVQAVTLIFYKKYGVLPIFGKDIIDRTKYENRPSGQMVSLFWRAEKTDLHNKITNSFYSHSFELWNRA